MQLENSHRTNNPLETQWDGVFIPYEGYPLIALTLAQNFQAIKNSLQTGPGGTLHVIQSMDEAIETLFPLSEFYSAGRELFQLAVQGRLSPAFDLTRFADQARCDTESW